MDNQQPTDKTEIDPIARTIRAYNEIAPAYSETWFNDPVMEPTLEEFLQFLEMPGEVLDAGCGSGRDILAMKRRGVEAIGIDLSSAMINEAKARVPGSIFRCMDLRRLNYPPETFVGIWACATLHHFPQEDLVSVLREFARVLKPNGILGVSIKIGQGVTFDSIGRYQNFHTATDFCQLVIESGFQIIKENVSTTEKGTLNNQSSKEWLRLVAMKSVLTQSNIELESNCVFCSNSRFQLSREIGLPASESILWGNNDLFITPDIAPLFEGHLLMVTTSHYICFGASPSKFDSAINKTLVDVSQLFQNAYEQVPLIFEHGPIQKREAGACIDHAHWHCIPAKVEIRNDLEKHFGQGRAASIETLRDLYNSGQSYLYLAEDGITGRAYQADIAPSQFFRQAVALKLGNSNWRWQTVCKKQESQNTFKRTLERLLPFVDKQFLA